MKKRNIKCIIRHIIQVKKKKFCNFYLIYTKHLYVYNLDEIVND